MVISLAKASTGVIGTFGPRADNSNRQLPFFVAPKASHTLGAFVLAILGNRDRNKIAHSVDWVDDCKAQRKGTGGIDARRKNN